MTQPKLIHKIALGALSLLVLIFIAGFIYVYYTDQTSPPKNTKSTTSIYRPITPPPPSNPTSPEGVSLDSLSSPVQAGGLAFVSVQTDNTSICTLTIAYSPAKPSNLKPVTTDPYGVAQWNFTIPANTPAGNYPIKITCTFNKKVGVYDASIQVIAAK